MLVSSKLIFVQESISMGEPCMVGPGSGLGVPCTAMSKLNMAPERLSSRTSFSLEEEFFETHPIV